MGTQVLAHLALDLARVRDDLVEVAVLADEGRRLLGADAGHAGDVVGGVALQAVEVRDQVGRNAVVQVVDAVGGHDAHVRDALARGDDPHAVGHQLVHVAVARDQKHRVAGGLATARQRAQDVVALPALELDHGHVHRAQQVLHHGELLVQGRVHRRALRLVLGQHLHAHGGTAAVEGADHAVGMEGVDHLEEHVQETEDGVGGAPVRRVHGRRHGVEGAVHQRVAVDDGDDAADAGGGCGIGHGKLRFSLMAPLQSTAPRRPAAPTNHPRPAIQISANLLEKHRFADGGRAHRAHAHVIPWRRQPITT